MESACDKAVLAISLKSNLFFMRVSRAVCWLFVAQWRIYGVPFSALAIAVGSARADGFLF